MRFIAVAFFSRLCACVLWLWGVELVCNHTKCHITKPLRVLNRLYGLL